MSLKYILGNPVVTKKGSTVEHLMRKHPLFDDKLLVNSYVVFMFLWKSTPHQRPSLFLSLKPFCHHLGMWLFIGDFTVPLLFTNTLHCNVISCTLRLKFLPPPPSHPPSRVRQLHFQVQVIHYAQTAAAGEKKKNHLYSSHHMQKLLCWNTKQYQNNHRFFSHAKPFHLKCKAAHYYVYKEAWKPDPNYNQRHCRLHTHAFQYLQPATLSCSACCNKRVLLPR